MKQDYLTTDAHTHCMLVSKYSLSLYPKVFTIYGNCFRYLKACCC